MVESPCERSLVLEPNVGVLSNIRPGTHALISLDSRDHHLRHHTLIGMPNDCEGYNDMASRKDFEHFVSCFHYTTCFKQRCLECL